MERARPGAALDEAVSGEGEDEGGFSYKIVVGTLRPRISDDEIRDIERRRDAKTSRILHAAGADIVRVGGAF